MAVQVSAVDPVASADPAHVLRKQVDRLTHERDDIKDRYDRALDKIADLEQLHRWHLAVRCDHPGCKATASVSTSSEPPPGILAQQLMSMAMAMRFAVSHETVKAMRALAAGRAVEIIGLQVTDRDLCPAHIGTPAR
jgi:hypothetical protein